MTSPLTPALAIIENAFAQSEASRRISAPEVTEFLKQINKENGDKND